MANEGKKFEQDVAQSAKNQGVFWLRLNDSSLSWQHERSSKFTPQNPCDFLAYQMPYMYAIECKSTKYKSMSIQRDLNSPEGMIKAHQIQSLVNFSTHEGVYAGLLLNFRNDECLSEGITYWLPIEGFSDFLCHTDKNSINRLDCVQYGGIIVEQQLKRTRFCYNVKRMLEEAVTRKEGIE